MIAIIIFQILLVVFIVIITILGMKVLKDDSETMDKLTNSNNDLTDRVYKLENYIRYLKKDYDDLWNGHCTVRDNLNDIKDRCNELDEHINKEVNDIWKKFNLIDDANVS